MVRTRSVDAKAVALQRTGGLGTFASSLGQEAVSVGAASAVREEDVLLPSFRGQGAQLWRGVTPLEFFLYWGGDERGSDFARARADFPVCVPVGSHAPHAIGVALAFKLRKEKRAAVSIFGDGATSKGYAAEALNIAGVWKLPIVVVVSNNSWAISMPRHRQSAAQTLALKAIAAGFNGEQVDGNHVTPVHGAVAAALERARSGGGPHLVEALTYRLCDHTTTDDASRYRDDAEVSRRWPEEPVLRLRRYLTELDQDRRRAAPPGDSGRDHGSRRHLFGDAAASAVVNIRQHLRQPAGGARGAATGRARLQRFCRSGNEDFQPNRLVRHERGCDGRSVSLCR